MRICFVASHGGHMTELLEIKDAFAGHELVFATYHSNRNREIRALGRAHFTPNIGTNLFRMIRALPWALWVLMKERPRVIVSTGAEVLIPFLLFAKLLRVRLIYLEGLARVTTLSFTGKLAYRTADLFLVQSEELARRYGPRAQYWGNVI